MAVDFNKALDVKAADIVAPPVPPIGHYVWQVIKVPSIEESGPWQMVNFNLQAVSVFEDADDVDMEALKEFGPVKNIFNRKTFMLNKDEGTQADLDQMLFNIKRFCADHLKIEGAEAMNIKEMLSASINKRCVGQLTHKPDKANPEVIRANIGKTAPIE